MSIASRIESIEEHIGNAYDSIEALGVDITDVDKNIENISSSIDGIYDTLPKVTGEGESITLDGTIKGRLKSTLKGNTSQTGTPTPSTPIPVNVVSGDNEINVCGRNLMNVNALFQEMKAFNSNVSKTIVDNKNCILFSSAWFHTATLYKINYKPNTIYTFRVMARVYDTTITTGYNLYLRVRYTDGTASGTSISANGSTWQEIRFTTNSNKTIEGLYFTYGSVTNWLIDEDSFNIIEGDTTDYEPYTGATYSINLPVENLLNVNTLDNAGGSSLTVDISNNEIKMTQSGSSTYQYRRFMTDLDINKYKGKTINFSYKVDNTNSRAYLALYKSDKTLLGDLQPTSYTIPSDTTASYIGLQIYQSYGTGVSGTVTFSELQIEEGSKANSYTPYGTTPIELCKIGDYEDTFIHDKTLDKWYLHKEVGKVVLDGSENWSYPSANHKLHYTNFNVPNIIPPASNGTAYTTGLNNRFTIPYSYNYLNGNNVQQGFAITSGGSIAIYYNEIDNNPDWLAYLSSNNVIFYYVLATPTDTEITYQPLIEQLNNLEKAMSYNGQTNISQVNNDLPFIISASALKEWQESNVSTLSMVNPLSLGNTLNTQENDIQPIEVDNIEPLEEGNYEES